MRARRLASAALLLLAAAASSPSASAADDRCPGAGAGGYGAGVCENLVLAPTPNTGYTVSGTVRAYCTTPNSALCPALAALLATRPIGATGADVNGNTPPVPTYDPSTGQVSAPAGTYATVFVNGTAYTVDTPAYCVTIDVRC